MAKQRVLSGMRPTGSMHLGNLWGALSNWVALQDEYDCYYFAADWHALTTPGSRDEQTVGYQFPDPVHQATLDMVCDWLAVGLDPERSCIFVQSGVPQVAELHLVFSMLTPLPWVERNPTYREQVEDLGITNPHYGLLGYPVLQAADILVYRGELVPVGMDQEKHVELSSDIAKRFNHLYGQVFPEPEAKLTPMAKVIGVDSTADNRRKMSKSANNHIALAHSEEETWQRIRSMYTDPDKLRKNDPGRPEGCTVFAFHELVHDQERCDEIAADCRSGSLGCVDCKRCLCDRLNEELAPVRERRQRWCNAPDDVVDVLRAGTARARDTAEETMTDVRTAIHFAKW